MRQFRSFARDERGAGAGEFVLVLPLFLLFIFGLIDVGRYAWAVNEMEKAAQVGARWAVATNMIPTGLADYSFATSPSTPVPQGDPISTAYFPGVSCGSTNGNVACTCLATCGFPLTVGANGQAAFDAMVARMRTIYPLIDPDGDDITVEYLNSGLGFAGDPDGPDVSPFVRVRINDHRLPMFFLLGINIPMPELSHTLTSEDAKGTVANY